MTITLYSSIRCPWAARTWLALLEAGIDFELVEIDLSVPREPWYLQQINPVGKVPALKLEDGTVICESSVCSEYIADLSGKLLPGDAIQRSKVKFFIETFTAKFPPALYSVYNSPPERQRELVRTAVTAVESLLKQYLAGGPFLLGSREYTLAEVDSVPFLARFRMLGEAGLYPGGLYEEISNSTEFELFNRYLDACLNRRSHLEIWHQEENLNSAKKRLAGAGKKQETDYIFLEGLQLTGTVGLSSFSFTDRKFPLSVSFNVRTEPVKEGSDEYAISYGDVARDVTAIVEGNSFKSLERLASAIVAKPRTSERWQSLSIKKEGGVLRADEEVFEVASDGKARYTIKGIRLGCIIGIYDHERAKKQDVVIHLTLTRSGWSDSAPLSIEDCARPTLEEVIKVVEQSTFKTVEALAQKVCEVGLAALPESVQEIQAWVSKPSALVFAKHSGVCITRKRSF